MTIEELLVALADCLWKGRRDDELEQRVVDAVATLAGKGRWDVFRSTTPSRALRPVEKIDSNAAAIENLAGLPATVRRIYRSAGTVTLILRWAASADGRASALVSTSEVETDPGGSC
ncbi:MAG: hypothetical protein KIT84_35870 [Labilithrix sp.]|nr:hypothetical protein [Labilithrix sp.]MCW5816432.1 hypothetical protein [Labilithrix sp.]